MPRAAPAGGEQAVCSAPAPSALTTPFIALDDARHLLGDPLVVFVDCRPRAEFRGGHIASAVSVPSDESSIAAAVVNHLRTAHTVIAYCDARSGCASSVRLAARLHELDIPDVRILTGGLPAWLERGFPAESGNCRFCPESQP